MGTNTVSRIGVAVCIVAVVVGLARGDTVVLAHTGEAIPGGPGGGPGFGTYVRFTDPVLNMFGQIAFLAELADTPFGEDSDQGIFRVDSQGAVMIAAEAMPVPTWLGLFTTLGLPALNDMGQVAFTAEYGSGVDGIYRGTGNTLPTQIVLEWDPAPDGNGCFDFMSSPVLNNGGNVAFKARFKDTAGGLDDLSGVVVSLGSMPKLVARGGSGAPDGAGKYRYFAFNDITIGRFGKVAFWARTLPPVPGDDDTGLFSALGYSHLSVGEGQWVPGGNGRFSHFGSTPTINQAGQYTEPIMMFYAVLRETSGGTLDDSGIFTCRADGLDVFEIAREGQSPPDGNGQYYAFDPNISQAGDSVAFLAYMRNTSGGDLDKGGIYCGTKYSVHKIARCGEPAPGGNGVFRYLLEPVMSQGGAGYAAFFAALVGTAGGSTDDQGIFLGSGLGVVELVRKGDSVLGSTITELHLANHASDSRKGVNGFAQVAVRVVLADGREALLLCTPLIQYSGGASGGWPDSANWTLGIAPAAVHDVAITPLGDVEVIGPRIDATVKSLTLGATGGGMATLRLTGGDLTAVGTVSVTLGGTLEVGAGRTLSAATLINQGTLTFGPGEAHVAGDVSNGPGGRILVLAGANAWMHGRVENQGAINVAAGGALHLPDFTGDGCTGAGTAWLEGHVRPGPGTWEMAFAGDAVFGPHCVTHIELRGPTPKLEYDQVSVAGVAVLEGELSVELINRYVPMPGDSFEVITCGSRVSEFASALGLDDLAGHAGLDFELTYAADGVTLTATAMGGDANLDATVDVFDLAILGNNYSQSAKVWTDADFTGDGDVNVFDLAVLANNYGRTAGGSAGLTTGGQAIPEPATILIVTVAGLPMLLKRRRNA